MILYLPLCLVSFPPNITILYNILLPLSALDIIPPEISTDLIFNFSDDFDFAYNDRLAQMGFDNHNVIENIGSMIYVLASYFVFALISLCLLIKQFKNKCWCWTKLKPRLPIIPLMSGLYTILFEGFLIIMISCLLSLQCPIRINFDDKFAYRLS